MTKARKDPRAVALQKAFKKLPPSSYSEHDLTAFAKSIDRTRQAVSVWKVCPAQFVLPLETASGVSRHELRPDIFGPAPADSGN